MSQSSDEASGQTEPGKGFLLYHYSAIYLVCYCVSGVLFPKAGHTEPSVLQRESYVAGVLLLVCVFKCYLDWIIELFNGETNWTTLVVDVEICSQNPIIVFHVYIIC